MMSWQALLSTQCEPICQEASDKLGDRRQLVAAGDVLMLHVVWCCAGVQSPDG